MPWALGRGRRSAGFPDRGPRCRHLGDGRIHRKDRRPGMPVHLPVYAGEIGDLYEAHMIVDIANMVHLGGADRRIVLIGIREVLRVVAWVQRFRSRQSPVRRLGSVRRQGWRSWGAVACGEPGAPLCAPTASHMPATTTITSAIVNQENSPFISPPRILHLFGPNCTAAEPLSATQIPPAADSRLRSRATRWRCVILQRCSHQVRYYKANLFPVRRVSGRHSLVGPIWSRPVIALVSQHKRIMATRQVIAMRTVRTNGAKRVRNRLLLSLPQAEYDLIRPHLDFVNLPDHRCLHEPHQRVEFLYFPN